MMHQAGTAFINRSAGTTFIELVVCIVVISIALLGTLISIRTVSLYSSDPLLTEQAAAIADSYLQEISNKSFPVTPCPAPSGGRSTYTNICHYNGLSQAPTDQNGNAIAGLGAYTVTVNVDTSTSNLGGLSGSNVVARIDMTVSHTAMTSVKLSTYVTNP